MSQIRLATASDLSQILDILPPYRSPGFNWDENIFRAEFSQTHTWVIEESGKIRAFLCLRDAIEAWEVSVLATRWDSRGQGFMMRLFESLIERYNKERHFWLEVHENNISAQKLYEKLGFRAEGHRGGYYSDGSAAILYTLPKVDSPS